MRYPYEVLLGGYKDHPTMGQYLQGRDPDFEGMTSSLYWKSLSTTENLFWRIAMVFHGDRPEPVPTVDEFGRLDRDHMWRLCSALIVSRQNLNPRQAHKEWIEFMGGLDWDAVPEGR